MEDGFYRVGPLILGRKPQHVLVSTGSERLDALLGGGPRAGWLTVLLDDREGTFEGYLSKPVISGRFCYLVASGGGATHRTAFVARSGRLAVGVQKTAKAVVRSWKASGGSAGLVDFRPKGVDDLGVLAEIAAELGAPVLALATNAKWYHPHTDLPPQTLVYDVTGAVRGSS